MKALEQAYWQKFKAATNIASPLFGSSWSFGNTAKMADDLGQLVLEGKKTGTTSALAFYELEGAALPRANKVYDMLLNGANDPIAILQTKKVKRFMFNDVTEEMARLEGEGDLSIAYWQAAHREVFKTAFARENLTYDEANLALIYEEFEVIYK
ncbi:ASCH domain-containing protein [Pseudolactococcus reticulitermitis]|uniref:ASCH domain-containing protein n=1 Tax=Pseudolactococcus reticulitermitis TaxID=2025039 RepID=A0A224XEU0_9LACT|nr:ASCH domain-containing protein [Lactococcus reticulitermitis]GAX48145.1 hypothetical protein RsY01_1760 [Lactococcus reticulitermitis]